MFRIRHSVRLLKAWVTSFLTRLVRILMHPIRGVSKIDSVRSILFWWLEWAILVLDLIGWAEMYQLVILWTRRSVRGLSDRELSLARSILKEDFVDWDMILINPGAFIITAQYKIAYVSFEIINYWGQIRDDTFIHELIHIWQYRRYGSVYIVRALRAQFSEAKYDYGGIYGLLEFYRSGGKFEQLNYEQQGDVLADYFRIKTGRLKLRGVGRLEVLELYQRMLAEWVI